jgi:hypothetical protein
MGADKYSSSTSMAMSAAVEKSQAFGHSRWTYVIAGAAVLAVVGLLLFLLLGGEKSPEGADGKPSGEVAEPSAKVSPRRRAAGARAAAGPGADARAHRRRPPMRRAARPMAQMVTLKVTVLPDEAEPVVIFRGKEYEGSEFRVLVARAEAEEVIEIRAPGYRRETLLLTPTQSLTTKVTLKPKARPRTRRRYRWRPGMRRRPMSFYLDLPE